MSHFNDTTQLTVKKWRSNTLRTTLVKKKKKNSNAPSSTIDLYITVYATGSKAKIKINALTIEIR